MRRKNEHNRFQTGTLSLLILSLLKRKDMYAAELIREIEHTSGGKLVAKFPTVYPVLYKLIDAGMISDRKEQRGRRQSVVYYHLEPSGTEMQADWAQSYREVAEGVLAIIGTAV